MPVSDLSMSAPESTPITAAVVGWAQKNLRDLPWRRSRDPWGILVAETMLQQTQVARVTQRWPRFLDRFPDADRCAAAPTAAIVREWEGLGYNRRAVMLHRAATRIVEHHGGVVPSDVDDLLALPGVGPYTARAVSAFAFEAAAAPVDTNIGRVLARTGGEALTMADAQRRADSLVPADAAWLYNQGVMELGATVCTKRTPRCDDCPLAGLCAWRGSGDDPAVGSAGASVPQARFAGSDRQLRGRLVDALRRAPVARSAVAERIACDGARADGVVDGLVRDGLVEIVDGTAHLAGEAVRKVR